MVRLRKYLFPMFKFRSIQVNAGEQFKEIKHLNEAEETIFKMSPPPASPGSAGSSAILAPMMLWR